MWRRRERQARSRHEQLVKARDDLSRHIAVLEAGPAPGDYVDPAAFRQQAAELKAILENINEQLAEEEHEGG